MVLMAIIGNLGAGKTLALSTGFGVNISCLEKFPKRDKNIFQLSFEGD